MRFERELVAALAVESGFRPETIEKIIRLGRLLADVARHPLLSEVLLLKGGTALNLFFGDPKRLSVDLDFNYVGRLDRDEMRAERPEVERAIETVARGQGYVVQRSAEEHAGRKFYLGYTNAGSSRDRIEVDINYLFRQPLLQPNPIPMWQPGDLERPVAVVVAFEELAAGKLCAFLERGGTSGPLRRHAPAEAQGASVEISSDEADLCSPGGRPGPSTSQLPTGPT